MTKDEHMKLGVEYFNKTWNIIDKTNRTNEEDIQMINFAHASRLHWELSDCSDLKKARGDWQISRVYNILNMGESALTFGFESLRLIEKNNYGDFDLVFAYETIALAYKVLGNNQKKKLYLDLAYKNLVNVKNKDDKEYCESELKKI
jgi:hypothetical protein